MSHKFSNTKRQRDKALNETAKEIVEQQRLARENELDFWFVHLPLEQKEGIYAFVTILSRLTTR